MIYNEDFLFIHVPKTAGMSVSHALVKQLKGQVYNTLPSGHGKQLASEIILPGKRHETLSQAQQYFQNQNRCLSDFKMILAVIRNPYDLEVSRFHYLRKGNECDRGLAQGLAMKGDFEDFAKESDCWFDIEKYITLGGKKPDNMAIVRFEELASELSYYCTPFLKSSLELPKLNYTERGHFIKYLTPEVEEAIFRRYRWVFESGFYSRYDFGAITIRKYETEVSWINRLKKLIAGKLKGGQQ